MFDANLTNTLTLWGLFAVLIQVGIIIAVSVRVMLTRHPPGSSFAWIIITAVIPYVGFILYLLFGERPIGQWREKQYRRIHHERLERIAQLTSDTLPPTLIEYAPLCRLASTVSGFPLTTGSRVSLLSETDAMFQSILRDINAAQSSIAMEFYIWQVGAYVDEVIAALVRARQRGVEVRLLLDDFGSRKFLQSPCKEQLVALGIHIVPAMPMKWLSMLGLERADLRLHHKTIVIDRRVAYTGSLNMIDPSAYEDADVVGHWVDALVRIEGPAVDSLNDVFWTDWSIHTGENAPLALASSDAVGTPDGASVLTIPSGPYSQNDPNFYLILEALSQAKETLTITTPYFVPNEALLAALQNAALRGVKIALILPRNSNNRAVAWAGRRHYEALLEVGVNILMFGQGLLHTKTILVDGRFALFGTVNLDNRSLHLNFETTLLIFDAALVKSLTMLVDGYQQHSTHIDPVSWHNRPFKDKIKEGLAYLISPLL